MHSSGNRMQVRSCTVTTSAPLRLGGTTKFGPCTTSKRPVQFSSDGWLLNRQAARRGRAAIGRLTTAIPGGTTDFSERAPRAEMAKAVTSISGGVNRARICSVQTPMPVRRPSSEVASKATRTVSGNRAVAAGIGESGREDRRVMNRSAGRIVRPAPARSLAAVPGLSGTPALRVR